MVFGKRLLWALGGSRELVTVHAHQVIQIRAEHIAQRAVLAALDDQEVDIQIAFLLIVGFVGLEPRMPLMGRQHIAQVGDIGIGHVLRRQPAGHAFQGLTHMV